MIGDLFGINVVESPFAVERKTEISRVRGGYMNHWLIRKIEVVERPCMYMMDMGAVGLMTFGGQKTLVIHPKLVCKLRNFTL